MINVSSQFKKALNAGEILHEEVTITYADGTSDVLDTEIMQGDNKIIDGAESNAFPVGVAIEKLMTVSIDNTHEQFASKYFLGATLSPVIKMKLPDGTTERVKKGKYTVVEPESYGEIIKITAADDMYKADVAYTTTLEMPQTVFTLVRDACDTCGITLGFGTMRHGDFVVEEVPENITFRTFFGYAAMIACANARIDINNKLQFVEWDLSTSVAEDVLQDYSGSSVLDAQSQEIIMDFYSGASEPYHRVRNFSGFPTVSADDITITGIRVKNEDNEYIYGTESYVINLENGLAGDKLETIASWLGEEFVGLKFRSMSGSIPSNPMIEFGDLAYTYKYVPSSGATRRYVTPITDVTFNLHGNTTVATKSDDPIRGQFMSGADIAISQAKNIAKRQKTTWQKAEEELRKAIQEANGLFPTTKIMEDGSTRFYFHDKPKLEESQIVIELNAAGWAMSTDGGKTYNGGMTVDGAFLAKIITTMGLNADWINTGSIEVKGEDGKTIFLVNMDTGQVIINPQSMTIGGKAVATEEYSDTAAAEAGGLFLTLDNEYQGIPTDAKGEYTTFPTCQTGVKVMYGKDDVTNTCTFTTSKSDNVDGYFDSTNKVYKVTGLYADTGWVDITATYVKYSTTKRFNIAKQKQGVPGRTYFLELSANSLVRGSGNTTITVSGYYRDGDSASAVAYAARYKMQISKDGVTWNNSGYTTANNTQSSFTVSANILRDYTYLRFIMYEAGGIKNALDMQSVPITSDASALTHEQVFNALTNDGAIKGIYKEGDQLYISFTYAKGGEAALGGSNNGYGTFSVYDKYDSLRAKISNHGMQSAFGFQAYASTIDYGYNVLYDADGVYTYNETTSANYYIEKLIDLSKDNYKSIGLNGKNFYWNDEAIELGDSGWLTLDQSNSSGLNNVVTPEYRKVNGQVFLRGAVSVKSSVANIDSSMGNTPVQYYVGYLPSGYRPTKATRIVCQTGGVALFLLIVSTAGAVTVSRYQTGGSYPSTIPSGTNFAFSVSFLAL